MITISSALKAVSISFKRMTDRIKFKSISKEALIAQVEDTKQQITAIDGTIFTLNKGVLEKAFSSASVKVRKDKATSAAIGSAGKGILTKLEKDLSGVIRKHKNNVFGPMAYVNKILIKCMRDIHEKAGDIVGSDNGFVVGETKLTQSLFLGVLESAKMYSRYNMYLIAFVSHINAGTVKTMPKYMIAFLSDKADNYVELVSNLCNVNGRYSVINDITKIKSSGLDLRLYEDDKNNAAIQSKLISDVLGVENVFLSIFNMAIVPIALIGEVYIDARHEYYQNMNEKKKWLEIHVANLRLNDSGADPDSKEAVQLEKAIGYYEDKISKMDKKLDSYYNN